ncbi:MAG TPA: LptF/LptG family permease [Gemmatimonadaceae bacterium]
MKIINRYVLKEHVGPLLFALTALTSLLLLNYIAKRFGQLVGKGLPWSVIGEFFLLSIPFTVAMTIPMAVLVATLYAFSRLAAENEITAFKASGVSVRRLLRPVLWAAGVLAVLMVLFNDQVLPRSNHELSLLQSDIFRKKPTLSLRPQVTNRITEQVWIRAGHLDAGSGRMREVVIYNFADPERPSTVYADSGTLAFTADGRNLALELYSGTSQEFPRDQPGELRRTRFEHNRVIVRDVGNSLERTSGNQPKGDREKTICEMQAFYDSVAVEYEKLHAQMATLAARADSLGAPVELPEQRANYSEHGLGALYCAVAERLGVPTAFAAAPPGAPARPVQDSAVARDTQKTPAIARGLQRVAPRPAQRPAKDSARLARRATPPAPSAAAETALRGLSQPASASTLEMMRINAMLQQDALNQYDVEIQKKFALAVACVIFVLLGAPIALRFPRGGVGLVIGVSLAVFALYYVALIAGESAADAGYLPPVIAMWAANAIFGAAGLALLARMGNEGATSRGGDFGELMEGVRVRAARLARRVGFPVDRRQH